MRSNEYNNQLEASYTDRDDRLCRDSPDFWTVGLVARGLAVKYKGVNMNGSITIKWRRDEQATKGKETRIELTGKPAVVYRLLTLFEAAISKEYPYKMRRP